MIRTASDIQPSEQLSLFDTVNSVVVSSEEKVLPKEVGKLKDILSEEQIWKLVCAVEGKYRSMDEALEVAWSDMTHERRIQWHDPAFQHGLGGICVSGANWVEPPHDSGFKKWRRRDFDFRLDDGFWERHLGTSLLQRIRKLSDEAWGNPEEWAAFWVGGLEESGLAGDMPFDVQDEQGLFAVMDRPNDRIIDKVDRIGARMAVQTLLLGYMERQKLANLGDRQSVSERGFALLRQFERVPDKNGTAPSSRDFWLLAAGLNGKHSHSGMGATGKQVTMRQGWWSSNFFVFQTARNATKGVFTESAIISMCAPSCRPKITKN